MAQGVSEPPVALEVHVTGRRILATILDILVLFVLGFILSLFFGTTSEEGNWISFNLHGFGALLYVVLVFAYYVVLESFLGQTLGKMLLGIKVVRERSGGLPGPGAATSRTLLRIIDYLPFFYLVGFNSVLATHKNQRLGDMVARTLVVRN